MGDEKVFQDCFYLVVEGKKYGPWLREKEAKFNSLKGRKGVKFEHVRLIDGWITDKKRTVNRRDKSLPLLEGLDIEFTKKRL